MTETQRGQILDELKWRGALNQLTDEAGLRKLTEEKSVSVYCGTDPTGDSLHVGHLIPFMILKRFQLHHGWQTLQLHNSQVEECVVEHVDQRVYAANDQVGPEMRFTLIMRASWALIPIP